MVKTHIIGSFLATGILLGSSALAQESNDIKECTTHEIEAIIKDANGTTVHLNPKQINCLEIKQEPYNIRLGEAYPINAKGWGLVNDFKEEDK